ncbi:hypothetical protein [Nannocystis sp. SCPEA4]|uniref:hypothetical protein n=1 Tax=Nannocystis sp. SCPEA4 TaxID=2996787 RepID=UPI002270CE55|nr:hypothetical protein [Nannocystis sp. SCPEA4]MCY1062870.1 hypothetical protein [Nannocystis sp. SCPEA4]
MKLLALLGLIAPLLIAACGDDGGTSTGTGATTDSTTGGSSETGTTTGTGTATDTTGDSIGETTGLDTTSTSTPAPTSTDATDTAAVTDTDATTTSTTTTGDTTEGDTSSTDPSDSTTETPGGDALAITLKDIVIYANCMPIVDPDNILGFWTVTYDNSQGAATTSAELTKATITLSPDNMPSVHDITVAPDQSGPVGAGETLNQEQMKQQGAPTPGCAFCNQPYRLDLTFQSGGVDVPVVHEATLDCVF